MSYYKNICSFGLDMVRWKRSSEFGTIYSMDDERSVYFEAARNWDRKEKWETKDCNLAPHHLSRL